MRLNHWSKAAVVAALITTGSGALYAQQPVIEQPAAQLKTDYTQQEMVSFAKAAIEINEINIAYQERATQLQQSDPQKAQELGDQASVEMQQVIVNQGMDVEQYQMIAMAAQSDEQFRERLLKTIRDLAE